MKKFFDKVSHFADQNICFVDFVYFVSLQFAAPGQTGHSVLPPVMGCRQEYVIARIRHTKVMSYKQDRVTLNHAVSNL